MRRAIPSGAPGAPPAGPPPRGLEPRRNVAVPPLPAFAPGGSPGAGEAGRARPDPAAPAGPAPAPAERVAARGSLRAVDASVAALLGALGVLVVVESVSMGIGWGSDGPESGFVPFWLAVVMVGCCLVTLVRTARRPSTRAFVRRDELGRVLAVLLPAAAMLLLTPFTGIYVAGALYMALYMRWAGRYGWPVSIALPLAFTIAVFLVFERWFLVPMPKGPLEAWLGY